MTLMAAGLCVCMLAGCGRQPKAPVESAKAFEPPEFQDLLVYTDAGQLYLTNLAGEASPGPLIPEKNLWFPAVSPDNRFIAYWSRSSGAFELWVYELERQQATQITFFNDRSLSPELQNFNNHNAPAWSPDSHTLAFARLGKLWTVDRQGFNLETLLEDGVRYAPAWSPSGHSLAYVSADGGSRNLFVWNRIMRVESRLTNFPAGEQVGSPAWSPDGTEIAFTLAVGERVDIWSVRPDGSVLTRLTKDGASNSPAWSPDSTRLAFSSGRQDPYRWNVWLMNRDGSRQFSITRSGGFSPSWLRARYETSLHLLGKAGQKASPVRTATPAAQPTLGLPAPVRTPAPTAAATQIPTFAATKIPTFAPTKAPTTAPTRIPTSVPTKVPTAAPTKIPTSVPTKVATAAPTKILTAAPTKGLTSVATPAATSQPTPAGKPFQPESKAAKPIPTLTGEAGKPKPTATRESEEDYSEYEQYANEDEEVLPQEELAVETRGNQMVFTVHIDFFFAKDMIKSSSLPSLKKLAEQLAQYPEAALVVAGQASGPKWIQGMLPLLRSLSRARANAVLQHLIVIEKIPQINVSAIGEGDPLPELGNAKRQVLHVRIR